MNIVPFIYNKEHHTSIERLVRRDKSLSTSEKLILLELVDWISYNYQESVKHKSKEKIDYTQISYAQLSDNLDLSRDTISKCLNNLMKKGYIIIEHSECFQNRTSKYYISDKNFNFKINDNFENSEDNASGNIQKSNQSQGFRQSENQTIGKMDYQNNKLSNNEISPHNIAEKQSKSGISTVRKSDYRENRPSKNRADDGQNFGLSKRYTNKVHKNNNNNIYNNINNNSNENVKKDKVVVVINGEKKEVSKELLDGYVKWNNIHNKSSPILNPTAFKIWAEGGETDFTDYFYFLEKEKTKEEKKMLQEQKKTEQVVQEDKEDENNKYIAILQSKKVNMNKEKAVLIERFIYAFAQLDQLAKYYIRSFHLSVSDNYITLSTENSFIIHQVRRKGYLEEMNNTLKKDFNCEIKIELKENI